MTKNITKDKYLETCVVIMLGLLVFWMIYKAQVLVTIAVAVGLIGAFVPFLAKWIHFGWYKLSEVMGYVMSRVILSLVFFGFLFPISLIYRLLNKDTLQLKKRTDSYWTTRSHAYTSKDLENSW